MKYHLFEVFGIELEYMIVSENSLNIEPIAHELLRDSEGNICADKARGDITWSNELSSHVIELKTTTPVTSISKTEAAFSENVRAINSQLQGHGAMLLPSAAHPLMNPKIEGSTWSYEGHEIYDCYKRLFDLAAHGWMNLQSVHLNLPFANDREFASLHAAVRCLLPFLPALSASSPILEGHYTQYCDSRLLQYLRHQLKLKASMGQVIPEPCFSEEEYSTQIFEPLRREIANLKDADLLRPEFLNARAAIARFERGSIEIRVLDIAECPKVDLALCEFIVECLRALVDERLISCENQKSLPTELLRQQLDVVIERGFDAGSLLEEFTRHLFPSPVTTVREFWHNFYQVVCPQLTASCASTISFLLERDNLSSRIRQRLGNSPSKESIVEVYQELALCLRNNQIFQ